MTATQADKCRVFVQLHQGPRPFVIPNPWDIGTARILTQWGFSALATTSAGLAFSLGRQDGAVTRERALAHSRSIVESTPLAVSADLENGYGESPEFVAETIRLAAEAGLAGASIEDATGDASGPIYDRGLAIERVAAAAEAARALDVPFTLTARAENFLHGRADLDDTLGRLQAYEAAGADVLCAPGLREIAQIREVCQAVARPVNVLMAFPGTQLTVDDLAAAGVRRVSLGSALIRAALGEFLRAAREIQDQGSFKFVDKAAATKELNAFFTGRPSIA